MIYYRQKIDSLVGVFDDYSVVILLGENYKILQRDAQNISDEIAGPAAENEMRIKKYFNHLYMQENSSLSLFNDYIMNFFNFCFELPLDNMIEKSINFKK